MPARRVAYCHGRLRRQRQQRRRRRQERRRRRLTSRVEPPAHLVGIDHRLISNACLIGAMVLITSQLTISLLPPTLTCELPSCLIRRLPTVHWCADVSATGRCKTMSVFNEFLIGSLIILCTLSNISDQLFWPRCGGSMIEGFSRFSSGFFTNMFDWIM